MFSSTLKQNRLWRIKNYSSRRLLYESLAARGEPSTGFPRDVTRREGSACATASAVILFELRTLPGIAQLLKISMHEACATSPRHPNKVIKTTKIVIHRNLPRIASRSGTMPVSFVKPRSPSGLVSIRVSSRNLTPKTRILETPHLHDDKSHRKF